MKDDEDMAFLDGLKELGTEDILLILKNDRPGERNVCYLTAEEGFEFTEHFINNNHHEIERMNVVIERRRDKLLNLYKSSLH